MYADIYEIMKNVLNVDYLHEEYQVAENVIMELIKKENINIKLTILRRCLEKINELFNDKEIKAKITLYRRMLICEVYYKIFFDSILLLDENVMKKFLYVYTVSKLTGKTNCKMNDFIKFLLVLNEHLENSIRELYNNRNKFSEDKIDLFDYRIEEILDCYSPWPSDRWDKIDKDKYELPANLGTNYLKNHIMKIINNYSGDLNNFNDFKKLLRKLKLDGQMLLYISLKESDVFFKEDLTWELKCKVELYKRVIESNMDILDKYIYEITSKRIKILVI